MSLLDDFHKAECGELATSKYHTDSCRVYWALRVFRNWLRHDAGQDALADALEGEGLELTAFSPGQLYRVKAPTGPGVAGGTVDT